MPAASWHAQPEPRAPGRATREGPLEQAEAPRGAFAELASLSLERAVAKELNERGIKTASGKTWTAVQVTRVRERLGLGSSRGANQPGLGKSRPHN